MTAIPVPSWPGVRPSAPILIVEDDAPLRQTIQWTLEDEGLPIELAGDGEEALEKLRTLRPSLVLLDMGLPRVDGFGVAIGLRALYGESVPIMVMTADGRAAEKAERVGAVGYVRKPFELDDLLAVIHRSLGHS
jgi:DNA-binding response OmpR family regulator